MSEKRNNRNSLLGFAGGLISGVNGYAGASVRARRLVTLGILV